MLGKTALKFCLFLIISTFFNFAIAAPYSEYEITSFSESLSPQVNVSGGVLVSYQMAGASTNADNESLYIARTADTNNLNILIKSVDGNYEAKFKITLNSYSDSWQKVVFPTKYQKKLTSYSAENVSVIAYVETPSKRKKKLWRVFPTSWGVPNEELQYFYVNSSGDFAKYVFKNIKGKKITKYCDPIKVTIQTAFNYRCPIVEDVRDNLVTFITEIDGKKDKYRIW